MRSADPGDGQAWRNAAHSRDKDCAGAGQAPVIPVAQDEQPKREQRRIVFDDSGDEDDLDVPDFLK